MGHARAIAGLSDPEQQKELAENAIQQRWSVRQLEEAIQRRAEKSSSAKKSKAANRRKDPYIDQIEEQLRNIYRTTVKVKHNKTKGKIEFSYYTIDDLERLLQLLRVEKIG